MKKSKRTLILAVILVFVLGFGGTMTAFAASTTVKVEIDSNQAVNSKSFYFGGGSIVSASFKAENNPNCHYYFVLKSPSLFGYKAILTTGPVLGNGSDVYTTTLYNLSSGNYIVEIRPTDGVTNGKTVTGTLTLN